MAPPLTFNSVTPNCGLPLLYAGQSQKELFVNQSLSLIDALLHPGIVASQNTPPDEPGDGAAFRIVPQAIGDWSGHEDEIAIWIASAWNFVPARDGMLLFDRAAGQFIVFQSGWQTASPPTPPDGGAVIDAEARSAIVELIDTLRSVGILAEL